jgi:hypothetical protein
MAVTDWRGAFWHAPSLYAAANACRPTGGSGSQHREQANFFYLYAATPTTARFRRV